MRILKFDFFPRVFDFLMNSLGRAFLEISTPDCGTAGDCQGTGPQQAQQGLQSHWSAGVCGRAGGEQFLQPTQQDATSPTC